MKTIFKHSIETSIRIQASKETVWKTLSNLNEWEQWNPFMVKASGIIAAGEKLQLTFHAPGMSPMKISPVVQKVEPGAKFSWLGSLGIRGIFDGEHIFELTEEHDVTILYHRENFSGALIPFMKKMLDVNTREGFIKMNEAVKAKCER